VEKAPKDELEGTETGIQDLEKQLKQKEWELTDERNMNRAKAHSELERTVEERIHGLQNQLETEQAECRRLLWTNKDAEKEKQLDVQRLQGIIADLENKLDKQTAEHA